MLGLIWVHYVPVAECLCRVGSPPALRDGQPTLPAPRASRAPSPVAHHRGPMLIVAPAIASAASWALVACAKPTVRPAKLPSRQASLRVVRTFPHDPRAFTQGLLFFEAMFYESTGLLGARRCAGWIRTAACRAGSTCQRISSATGLARVGGRLFQTHLAEQARAGLENLATLRKEGEISYQGEGWACVSTVVI